MKHYLIAAFQIILLVPSAIWTRNYIGNVGTPGPIGDYTSLTPMAYAISGCISSVLFVAALVWILSSAPARAARANRRRQ